MLPRALHGSATSPPTDWQIRRVVSEVAGLRLLRQALIELESEPTTWFAPSQKSYAERLATSREELNRAVARADDLVAQLQQQHGQWPGALVVGA